MKKVYSVLVIDDALDIDGSSSSIPDELMQAFQTFNKDKALRQKLPQSLGSVEDYEFDPKWIKDPYRLEEGGAKGVKNVDIFVIDRKFVIQQSVTDRNRIILRPLRDLRVPGIRIVWTAYPDEDRRDLIECMRLGAWDYLDKGSARFGDVCTDVIVSCIEGLREREWRRDQTVTDTEGAQFVAKHYGELYPKYAGQFVAFEKEKGHEGAFRFLASDQSLVSLNLKLEEQKKPGNKGLHITQFIK